MQKCIFGSPFSQICEASRNYLAAVQISVFAHFQIHSPQSTISSSFSHVSGWLWSFVLDEMSVSSGYQRHWKDGLRQRGRGGVSKLISRELLTMQGSIRDESRMLKFK
jgi:hypothetical protein